MQKKTHRVRYAYFVAQFLMILSFNGVTAHAGGSGENVIIESFERKGSKNYTIVVKPPSDTIDPYMKGCHFVTIQGDFSWWAFWFHLRKNVTLDQHETALSYLEYAHSKNKMIHLGWMGTAFKRESEDDRCTLKSRMFHISDYDHYVQIISYYNPV